MTPHVQTYSGRMVPLDAPRPQMIALGDIAHALARIPRFNGHTTALWSVADHSLLVLDLMPAVVARRVEALEMIERADREHHGATAAAHSSPFATGTCADIARAALAAYRGEANG